MKAEYTQCNIIEVFIWYSGSECCLNSCGQCGKYRQTIKKIHRYSLEKHIDSDRQTAAAVQITSKHLCNIVLFDKRIYYAVQQSIAVGRIETLAYSDHTRDVL